MELHWSNGSDLNLGTNNFPSAASSNTSAIGFAGQAGTGVTNATEEWSDGPQVKTISTS